MQRLWRLVWSNVSLRSSLQHFLMRSCTAPLRLHGGRLYLGRGLDFDEVTVRRSRSWGCETIPNHRPPTAVPDSGHEDVLWECCVWFPSNVALLWFNLATPPPHTHTPFTVPPALCVIHHLVCRRGIGREIHRNGSKVLLCLWQWGHVSDDLETNTETERAFLLSLFQLHSFARNIFCFLTAVKEKQKIISDFKPPYFPVTYLLLINHYRNKAHVL